MKHTLAVLAATLFTIAPPVLADDRLDVVAQFEIQPPEPSTTGYIFTRMGVAETLVNADPDGALTPGLATDWAASEDGLNWTITLRDGVQFHDGTVMTAETVASALDIARGKPGPLSKTPVAGISAGDGTVVITLSEPFAALPAYLAHYSAQILAPAAYGADGAGVAAIGTGPYSVTDLTPPLSLKAEAFPDYWGSAPHVPNVSYAAVSRVETRALMAESGEADFVFGLDPASVARLDMSDAATVHSVAIPRTLLLKVNASHPALSEAEARQALSLAIDRDGIAKAVLRYPEGATQLLPPSVGGWHDETLAPLAYDPDAARALLADLGWTAGNDGILTRDGQRFALTLTTYPDRPELPLVASVLEQQFRAIGVELTINTTNSSEISAGHADGSLDLGLIARNFGLIPNPVGTVLSDYAPTGDWGAMGWQNDDIVALARAVARGGGSDADRARIVEILQTELPIIPIAWYRQTLAVAKGVEGAVFDPWERTFGLQELKLTP
ncbi:Glutathione-binding protein GsiB precursor [Sulfitobacter sp. THAF37]|uniref:ABC transporter substrate-binding protein n=1 Tax=Sulfitobacter sp. THAF37 TaxID=2587855 RepID=UPI001268F657|nr:ABC transporter substrate-binding protein [Sulfitobacter sp. THAF37]QFT59533.1 Glutathione-binding protein GsiB precursor [Sulfitobacter sp. THAF37]